MVAKEIRNNEILGTFAKRVIDVTLLPMRKTLVAVISTVLALIAGCGVPNHHDVARDHSGSMPQFSTETVNPIKPATYVQLRRLATGSSATSSELRTEPTLQLGTNGENAVWINEVLAVLHYLPVDFVPSDVRASFVAGSTGNPVDSTVNGTKIAPSAASVAQTLAAQVQTLTSQGQTLANQVQASSFVPMPGTWAWSGGYPTSLQNLWRPDEVTVMTQGAIMSFERQDGLTVDGIAGPEVIYALVQALTANNLDPHPYVYALVTKTAPEQIDVFEAGQKVYSSLANTGIPVSPTPNGTWPVYLRLPSQTMKGTDPSGQKYSDPGVPWISYFYQGDAIHGFPRASYGSPQSLGCVELPISSAKNVYSLVHYGTLVTVEA